MEEAVLNSSLVTPEWILDNVTTTAVASTYGCRRILTTMEHLVITSTYAVGILGNIAALAFLCRIEKKHRKAHTLMLQCLASNDLVALLGMLVLMHLQQYLPRHLACSHAMCVVRVIWRMFGLSSGCVAIVMAVERWLALTHPFLYQKHITYHVIRRAIFFLWTAVVVLVSLPLFGFGLYYEPSTSECVRYRQAKKPKDIAYAYLFFTFGVLLCICIVWCNLAVIRVLCHMGCRGSKRAMLGRRISRNSGRLRSSLSSGSSSNTATTVTTTMLLSYNASTPEEVAFARLMAVLCIGFVACWMPQMITILLAQFAPKSRFSKPFFKLADILILLHFTLDPFIYVLLRCQRRSCFPNVFKILCHACWSHHGGNGSQQTSIAMTDNEHCPSLDPSGEPSSEVDRATAAAV